MVAAAICSGVGIVRICLRHTEARTVSRQRLAMARRIRVRDLIRRNACIACGVCAILIPLAVGHTDWMKLYEIYCNQMNQSMGSNADFDYAATNYYEDHGIEKTLIQSNRFTIMMSGKVLLLSRKRNSASNL